MAPHRRIVRVVVAAGARSVGPRPGTAAECCALRTAGPSSEDATETAASGAVAGVMARTDTNRGVWAAPAGGNGTARGIADVYVAALRRGSRARRRVRHQPHPPRGRAARCSGARARSRSTIRSGSTWTSSLSLLIERVIATTEGICRWAVFKPNAEPLWKAGRCDRRSTTSWRCSPRAGAWTGTRQERRDLRPAAIARR